MSTFKETVESTINDVKQHPEKGAVTFASTSILGENTHVKTLVRDFEFSVDEPQLLGGNNSAPNPVEYTLASLGACQAITYRALAALKGITLKSLKVEVQGDLDLNGFFGLDKNTRPGFKNIRFETFIESDESQDKLDRLVKNVEQLCPVLDTLSNPVAVSARINFVREEAAVENV